VDKSEGVVKTNSARVAGRREATKEESKSQLPMFGDSFPRGWKAQIHSLGAALNLLLVERERVVVHLYRLSISRGSVLVPAH
jgi:hypothetical protein